MQTLATVMKVVTSRHLNISFFSPPNRGCAKTDVVFCLQVEPMFTVPAPPAPGHPGAPGSSLPSAPSFSSPALPTSNPKQLVVRTRSIGTNTQDGGISGTLEGDAACLGPCQPGTSVNLEGIVWHETEEGEEPDGSGCSMKRRITGWSLTDVAAMAFFFRQLYVFSLKKQILLILTHVLGLKLQFFHL